MNEALRFKLLFEESPRCNDFARSMDVEITVELNVISFDSIILREAVSTKIGYEGTNYADYD